MSWNIERKWPLNWGLATDRVAKEKPKVSHNEEMGEDSLGVHHLPREKSVKSKTAPRGWWLGLRLTVSFWKERCSLRLT